MSLPKYTGNQQAGNRAITLIQNLFEKKGWLFRRGDGGTDFGVDAEIEIVDQNLVTGKLIKVQVKGTSSNDLTDGYTTVQISTTTWNNWKAIGVPVVCLLCVIDTEKIYWCLPLGYEPKQNSASVSIKFFERDCVNTDFSKFNSIINSWLQSFPKTNILLEVPFFHQLYTEKLMPLIDHYDFGSELEDEEDMQSRVFYQHALELRSSVGLTNEKIFPYSYWAIRNEGVFRSDIMTHTILSELISYIGYYYNQALECLVERLSKVEQNRFDNIIIINYFIKKKIVDGSREYFFDNAAYQRAFHNNIENALREVGYKVRFKFPSDWPNNH